jgi:hypothetical protein
VVHSFGESSNANSKAQAATCSPGKKAVGGGGSTTLQAGISGVENLVAIHLSQPFTMNSENDSWLVQAVETSPDNLTTWTLSAWAVCLAVS